MKQFKYLFSMALSLVLLLGTMTACSSGGTSSGSDNSSTGSSEIWSDSSNDAGATGDFFTSDTIYPENSGGSPDNPGATTALEEKMIYTAYLVVETTAYERSAADLDQIVEDLGGYYESRNISNYDTYRNASYTIRIPAERYHDFLTQVGQACHVLSMDENQVNVSTAYYDVEARLTTQRTKLERLQSLLAEADNMADIITIESAISETELAIEQLEGSLRDYDSRIDYATVTLSLREVYKLSNSETPATTFSQRIADAFAKGCRGFVNFMEGLAVLLVTAWVPVVIVVAAAVAALAIRRRKRGRKSSGEAPSPKDGGAQP